MVRPPTLTADRHFGGGTRPTAHTLPASTWDADQLTAWAAEHGVTVPQYATAAELHQVVAASPEYAAALAAASEGLPDGLPGMSWTTDQLAAWAAVHGVDLAGADCKERAVAAVYASQAYARAVAATLQPEPAHAPQ